MVRKERKKLLHLAIGISLIPMIVLPINFLNTGFFILTDVLWIIGSWLGLLGFMLIFWEYILGVRFVASFFSQDIIFINNLHKLLGIYGFSLIFLHPVLISIDFLAKGTNIINLSFLTIYDLDVFWGKIAFALIVLTWILSYLVRVKITFRLWKRIHLINYIILPLVFIHSNDIGTFFRNNSLKNYFIILMIIYVFIILFKIGSQYGLFKYKYKVESIEKITHDTFKVNLKHINKFITPIEGQFIEIQINILGENHPFTVSHYDTVTKELSITIKISGDFTKLLSTLKKDKIVFIEGPYGTFTKEAYNISSKKIVLIVGGIGITPFLRLINFINNNPTRYTEVALFYGNKTINDIAFKEKLDQMVNNSDLKVINVLSNSGDDILEKSRFEKGYITCSLLSKYLSEELITYKFFICGPPIMMNKIKKDLINNNVRKNNIYTEAFNL